MKMADIEKAKAGHKFMLRSANIDEMFCTGSTSYANANVVLGHSKYPGCADGCWWTLEKAKQCGDDAWYILQEGTKKKMYGEAGRGEVGITPYGSKYDDQLWQVRPSQDSSQNKFQLINYTKHKLFLRNHTTPAIGLCAPEYYDHDDQFFLFQFC